MTIDTTNAMQTHAHHLVQAAQSLCLIDARTRQLALALGLSLENTHDLERVLNSRTPAHGNDARAKRQDRAWMELRGMLVMRYRLERRLALDHGPALALELLHMLELRSLTS